MSRKKEQFVKMPASEAARLRADASVGYQFRRFVGLLAFGLAREFAEREAARLDLLNVLRARAGKLSRVDAC